MLVRLLEDISTMYISIFFALIGMENSIDIKWLKLVSITRECYNHKLQTISRHCEEETRKADNHNIMA